MPLEWLIDIIKEWVLSLGYATEAWVSEWFTPYSVTGPLNPNATCLYFKAGTHDDKPYYRRSDGEWFIWWDSPISWVISQTVGSLVPVSWFRVDPDIEGLYLTGTGATGPATVSLGYRSLCASFVDRGDPAVPDWTEADFIRDGTWRDLDLSSIVPAGAKVVLFEILSKNTLVNKDFQMRKKGNVNVFNVSLTRTLVGGLRMPQDKTCPCDSNRFVQYWYTAGGIAELRLTVKGWWL